MCVFSLWFSFWRTVFGKKGDAIKLQQVTVDVIVKPAVAHYIVTIKECLWFNGKEVYCCALSCLPFVSFYGTPLIFPSFGTSHVSHVHAPLRVQVLTYNTGMVAYSKQSLWQQACPIYCMFETYWGQLLLHMGSVTYMTWLQRFTEYSIWPPIWMKTEFTVRSHLLYSFYMAVLWNVCCNYSHFEIQSSLDQKSRLSPESQGLLWGTI